MWKKFLLAVIAATAVSGSLMAKELKVLMIGNSFSISVGRFLPQIVGADPENKLILTSAYIGGCPLEKHYNNLLKAQEKPSYAPYKITVWDSGAKGQDGKGTTADFISGLYKSIPPLSEMFDMAGMNLPGYLGEKKPEPTPEITGNTDSAV